MKTQMPPATQPAPATTGTPGTPANLSVAQLGAMFSRKSAPSSPPVSEPEPTQPQEPVETAPEPEDSGEAAEGSPVPSQTVVEETALEPGTEPAPETPEPAETPEGEPEAEPAPAELPRELAEAIAEAKASGQKGKADLLKRVHKLTDQRDAERNQRLQLTQELDSLRTQLEEARQTPQAPAPVPGADPVATHPQVKQLSGDIAAVDSFLRWADANPEGGEIDNGGKPMTLTAEQVAQYRANAVGKRQELVAELAVVRKETRQQIAALERQFTETAAKSYPWLNKPESAEAQEMEAILKSAPWLAQFANHKLWIADSIRGRLAREAAEKANAPRTPPMQKPKGSPVPPKVVTEPSASRPKVDPARKQVENTEQQFKTTGKTEDLAKSFAAKRRAKSA